MSKSLGNFSTIKDILKQYHPEAVRYFLLTSHYRSPIDFNTQVITDAHKSLARFYELFSAGQKIEADNDSNADPSMVEKFKELMDDDFNTATAIALFVTELKTLNRLRDDMAKMKKKSDNYKNSKEKLTSGIAAIKKLGGVLGLFGLEPGEFIEEFKSEKLKEIGMSAEELEATIEARAKARSDKDFTQADQIRDGLLEKGIKLSDTPEGVTWSISFD
jgi:cysteinyl-tRNA synthetase